MTHHIGIDVSKRRLDVFVLESRESKAFPNDESGVGELVSG